MHDWHHVRVFGTPHPTLPLVPRPSAYAFLFDPVGRIALVRAPDGVYLPGGGIEPGETPGEAVVRESLEECGLLVSVGPLACRAIQFARNEAGDACHEKRCWFYEATILRAQPERLLPGHETLWVPPADAQLRLAHASQVWAITEGRVA
jgi:8-oxo-dGTP diphosphatase